MGITDPSEEYFKSGLWGWATSTWEKLLSVGGRLFTALHGWDGTNWRKLPLLWGYSDRWHEDLGGTQSGAGTYSGYTTAVPAGYVYVLQVASLRNASGARGRMYIQVYSNSTFVELASALTPAQNWSLVSQATIVLKEGDRVQILQTTCSDGDTLYGGAWGYKMKIAE